MLARSGTFLLATLLFSPLAAHAQDGGAVPPASAETGGARELFQRGQVAYAQGDYDLALELWTEAYGLDARPLLQWNISQACERLGRLEEAAAALELYLANADPADEHQADARARLGALRERIAATGILFRGGPEGATLTIDGADAGRLPRPDPIRVSAGSHDIVVSAPGYEPFRSTVGVPAGDQVEVEVSMAGAGGGSAPPIAGIVLFGVAGVSTITAAVLGGVALGQAGSAPASTGPEADSARGLALGADVLFGIGAASAIAAVIATVVELSGSSSSEAAALDVVPVASATEGGLVVRGSF
jgi:hypothetical protein